MDRSQQSASPAPRRIAYVMSRFPKLTETFILYEILELERLGVAVEIFPLIREREPVMHAEAQALVERAHFSRPLAWKVLLAQGYWLRHRPGAYIGAWWRAVAGNLGSPKFLVRALAVVPQAAWFARQMAELGVEHVHAHWATHPALAAYVVQRLAGLPYSFTAHAHDIYVERPMLDEKLRAARFVATISAYNRRLLVELYGELAAKVRVVRCGVDATIFQPPSERPSRATPVLLCVGSLQPYKGHTYLIAACARLKAAGVAFQCLLVGDGELRGSLEAQIAQLGLGAEIRLLGQQTRAQVSALMSAADVMVLPSVTTADGKREGVPVALMEAMATGLPVVASASSGIPELVLDGRTGLLAPERDAAALAEALGRLCADASLRHRLGAAGREHVLREFSLATNVARLKALLLDEPGAAQWQIAPAAEPAPLDLSPTL